MAVTAKARSMMTIRATTTLSPSDALEAVKQAAEKVVETGYGRANGKFVKSKVRVRVKDDHGDWLALYIGSEITKDPWTTFSAVAEPSEFGTALRVGGLEKYRTFQTKWFGLIPTGPATIYHFGLYKKFLREVGAQLAAQDSAAAVSIGSPEL
jgi:hypothetical protein